MAPLPDDDHDCGWKAYAKEQQRDLAAAQQTLLEVHAKLAALTAQVEDLQRRRKGHQSERRKSGKMPPPLAPKADPSEAARKRAAAQALRDASVETEVVPVPVPPEQRACPCTGARFR